MIRVKGVSKTLARVKGTVQATIKVETTSMREMDLLEEFVKLWNKIPEENISEVLDVAKAKEAVVGERVSRKSYIAALSACTLLLLRSMRLRVRTVSPKPSAADWSHDEH